MNRGVPPTARKARTGEFTPPGVTRPARSNNCADTGASYGYGSLTAPLSPARLCAPRRTGTAPLQGPGTSVRLPGARPRPEARPERARGEEDGVLPPSVTGASGRP